MTIPARQAQEIRAPMLRRATAGHGARCERPTTTTSLSPRAAVHLPPDRCRGGLAGISPRAAEKQDLAGGVAGVGGTAAAVGVGAVDCKAAGKPVFLRSTGVDLESP